ncbi:preprotein translocase subunit SecA [Bacillus safensis FO-36b] [Bacillus safensis subsp. safensis]
MKSNKVFDPTKRTISRYEKKANEIETIAQNFEKLSDEALRNKTIEFKEKVKKDNPWMTCWLKHLQQLHKASRRVTGNITIKVPAYIGGHRASRR